ncbi:MAG: hypothetical protein ACE5GN_06360, partial [Waddliaceae bacterium]
MVLEHKDYAFRSKDNPLTGIVSLGVPSSDAAGISGVAGRRLHEMAKATDALPPIDHCSMTDEEVQQHSLLNTIPVSELPDIREMMHANRSKDAILQLAANFLGGGLITGGAGVDNPKESLDGLLPLPNFMIWGWLLENLHTSIKDKTSAESRMIENLLQGIAQLKEFSHDIETVSNARPDEKRLQQVSLKYTNKVKGLRPGQSLPIYGGWGNVGGGTGHALIYEFTRRQDNKFDVYVYTSTGYQLTDTILHGDKTRLKPIIHYSAVPENHLLLNGDGTVRPLFIQSLLELKVLAHWDNDPVVDAEDVYEIFDYLAPYRKKVSLEEFGAVTGQRAGTCVPSSTKQWIRRHARNQGLYKQLMFHTKLRMMVGVYRSLGPELSKDTKKGALSRRLLKQIARKLLRRIAKLTEEANGFGALVNAELAQKGQATAYDLLKHVSLHEKAISEKRSALKAAADLSKVDTDVQRLSRRKTDFRAHEPDESSEAEESSLPDLKIEIHSHEDVNQALQRTLDKFIEIAPRYATPHRKRVGNLQIHHIMDQLPLPKIPSQGFRVRKGEYWIDQIRDDFWDKLSPREMGACLKSLEAIAKAYATTSAKDSPTRCHTTVSSLHTLTHFLALKIDAAKRKEMGCTSREARLEHYKIPFFGTLANNFEGLIYYDRNEYERTQQAIQYFKAFNTSARGGLLFASED